MDVLNSQRFHFESIWNLVVTFLTEGQKCRINEKILRSTDQSAARTHLITRSATPAARKTDLVAYYASKITITRDSQIVTREAHKIYKCVNTKGIIDTKTSIVYPFGFQLSNNRNL